MGKIEAKRVHNQNQIQKPKNPNEEQMKKAFNFESESTIVRLSLNALQGIHSSLTAIETLSESFRSDPADTTFHRIPSLWSHSSSTHSIANILNSFAFYGSFVYLLRNFVHFHQNPPSSLVNQAFAVAVGKVLEGYVSALDTLYASVEVRRCLGISSNGAGPVGVGVKGCLKSVVVHSEVSLLEVYLHTKELRIKIHALASICMIKSCFSGSSFEDSIKKASGEFANFPRGGDLLTYLYSQLEFADPVHRSVLKFLFLRSCEPYCRFIREWIYEAKISDPYKEFAVEYGADNRQPYCDGNSETHFQMAAIREEQDQVAVPCFLQHQSIPLLRAGQQLQVWIKLRQLCKFSDSDLTYEDIIPYWGGFSSFHPSYASLLTFNKAKIEAMVAARSSFYTRMHKKLENRFTKMEIRHPKLLECQVVRHDRVGILNSPATSTLVEGCISSSVDQINLVLDTDTLDSDASTSADEFVDQLGSSECSSESSIEEENESAMLIENSSLARIKQVHLSSSRVLPGVSFKKEMQMPLQSDESKPEDILPEIDPTDPFGQFTYYNCNKGIYLNRICASLEAKKQHFSWMPETVYSDNHHDMNFLPLDHIKASYHKGGEYLMDTSLHLSKDNLKMKNLIIDVLKEVDPCFSNVVAATNSLTDDTPYNGKFEDELNVSSSVFNLQSWMLKQNRNFLSMNPTLSKHSFFHLMGHTDESSHKGHRELLSCFDFSSIEDPFKVSEKNVNSSSRPGFRAKLPLMKDSDSSAMISRHSFQDKLGCDEIDRLVDKSGDVLPSVLWQQNASSAEVSGGSSWETMLAGSGCTINDSVGDYEQSFAAMFEIPLDFIIDKCLVQEIMLQYKYISKVTIKLLEEGFDLHEHLMALRRYHFMEVADWADLFISSLWHHKWYVTGADKRVTEIQGLLELSAQRSSCEDDHNKDRLFVAIKGQGMAPLSTSAIGVHSFDFISLRYRVDWPVSIILTSGALEIYAEIFNFLVRVKLAVFALTDLWGSLKDLMRVLGRNCHSEFQKMEVRQINYLMKIRHQINHFVCTLQQYVLSQLSHVSWWRFLHSLKIKVKDMMDFESVHMAYLSESLQICFLSAETQSVARIVENILQCALDFQSCLVKETWRRGAQNQEDSSCLLSHVNINEVLVIKKRFDKELKELYLCYVKSPKHGDFGLFRFWEYLNCNEYYSNAISDEMGLFTFSP